jgi:hypothetical protein
MAYDFNGTNQSLSIPSSVISGALPVAMSVSFYPTSTTGAQSAIYLRGGPGGYSKILSIGFGYPTTAKAYFIQRGSDQNPFPTVNSSANVTLNGWNHILGQSVSLSSHQVWLNGTKATASIVGQAIAGGFSVGAIGSDGGTSNYCAGRIAEVGIWNASLSDDEVLALSKGMTCDKVRPQSLVFYAPLVRNLQDVRGGLTITNNNTATVANHPRVYA